MDILWIWEDRIQFMMSINKFVVFNLLVGFSSCIGQNQYSEVHPSTHSVAIPRVIRSIKAVGVSPDFDTTLVSQYIRSIFQDSKGNLWFGTIGEGVVRYDEKTLTYFSDREGLFSQSVHAIQEDKIGNLWLGTDKGVYKYNGRNFKKYSEREGLSQIEVSRKGILVDKNGIIWVGTRAGVFRYNQIADTLGGECFSMINLLPPVQVTGIMEDKRGNIWFASSDNGVFCYDGVNVRHISEKVGLGNNYAGGMAEDNAGNLWFTFKGGICKYDGNSFTEITPKDGLGGTEFWGLCIEQSGIIWVTARGSTTRFNPSVSLSDPKAFTVFTPADGLNCCVQSMYQDNNGNMWWGAGSGIFRFNGINFYKVRQYGPW